MGRRPVIAETQFEEFFNRAISEGPQEILWRGVALVVLSKSDYEKVTGKRPSFKEFLLDNGPNLQGLDLNRDRSLMRI